MSPHEPNFAIEWVAVIALCGLAWLFTSGPYWPVGAVLMLPALVLAASLLAHDRGGKTDKKNRKADDRPRPPSNPP